MVRKPAKPPPRKRHHTERFRAPQFLTERWTNAKAGVIGFYVGQHKTSVEIATILRDGTSDATIRRMVKLWRIPRHEAKRGYLVELNPYKRKLLLQQAGKLGITPEEFLMRISDCVIGDRLYEAVTDGRYDR